MSSSHCSTMESTGAQGQGEPPVGATGADRQVGAARGWIASGAAWGLLAVAQLILAGACTPNTPDTAPPAPPAPTTPTCSRFSYDLQKLPLIENLKSRGPAPRAISVEDVTGDGLQDVLFLLDQEARLVIMHGESQGRFAFHQSYPLDATPKDLRVADINKDGNKDVLAVGHFSNALMVLLGTGGGLFKSVVSYPLGNHSQQLEVADLNQDGRLDVLTKNGGSNGYFNITALMGNGDGTFGTAMPYLVSDAPMDIEVADINRDGLYDVLVAIANRMIVDVFHGEDGGRLTPQKQLLLGEEPLRLYMSDINGDDRLDLLVTHGFALPGYVSIRVGLDPGAFGDEQKVEVESPVALITLDVNEDGLTDLVTTTFEGTLLYMQGTTGKLFTIAPVELYRGTLVTALATSSLDGNSSPDLVWITNDFRLEVMLNVYTCSK